MRPKLCCVLQRCCRLDMHLVEGVRNFAVHEILAQFFPYHRVGLHDQHLSVIVMWCLEYEFASYSEAVFLIKYKCCEPMCDTLIRSDKWRCIVQHTTSGR